MTAEADRKQRFDELIADADERQLGKCIDFAEHRFISIEKDKLTVDRYAKGHKSLRGACNYLARSVEEGEAYVPELIFDLDKGVKHELKLTVYVTPESMDAVGVLLPREMAEEVLVALEAAHPTDVPSQVLQLIQQAIDRR